MKGPPPELDDEESLTLVSDPSPCGHAPTDLDSSSSESRPCPGGGPSPPRGGGPSPPSGSPRAMKVPSSDLPVVPNVYHGPACELRNAVAVWWHKDTICILTLQAEAFPLFWDHARLGTPEWWGRGPSMARSCGEYDIKGVHVVMRPWVGPAVWAPLATMGEVMEATFLY